MTTPQEHPAVTSGRREAIVTFTIWILALVYCMTYYALFGLGRDPATVKFILGIPDWVVYGVLAPWLVCYLISIWFSFGFMKDVELGKELDEEGMSGGADA